MKSFWAATSNGSGPIIGNLSTAPIGSSSTVIVTNPGLPSAYITKSYAGETHSKVWLNSRVNTCAVDTGVKFYVGGVLKTINVVVTASTPGFYSDASNSDAAAAGDTISYGWNRPAGSGGVNVISIGGQIDSGTSEYISRFMVNATVSPNGSAKYGGLASNGIGTSTEANAKTPMATDGTFRQLSYRVYTNTYTQDLTLVSRINGADGNLTVTIPAGFTGVVEDITHSDSVSVGDTYSYAASSAAATGAVYSQIAVEFASTDGFMLAAMSSSALAIPAGATSYLAPQGTLGFQSTESYSQIITPGAFRLRNFRVFVYSATGDTVTAVLRKNGVATSVGFSIPAGTSGWVEDSVNTLDVADGDLLSWELTKGASGITYFVAGAFDGTELSSGWSVTYNGNGSTGGSAPTDPSSPYTNGDTVTVLSEGTLVKSGDVFTGWNTAADGSGTSRSPSSTFSIGANTTLYAQWAPYVPSVAVLDDSDDVFDLSILSSRLGIRVF